MSTARDDLTVPGWFIKLVTGAIFLCAPFFVWITVTLLQLQFQVQALNALPEKYIEQQERVLEITNTLDKISARLASNEEAVLSTKGLHQDALKTTYVIQGLEKDIKQIKDDLSSLKSRP